MNVLISRDPKDIVVSYAYYLDKITEDSMSLYAKDNNLSQKQKSRALPNGKTAQMYFLSHMKS